MPDTPYEMMPAAPSTPGSRIPRSEKAAAPTPTSAVVRSGSGAVVAVGAGTGATHRGGLVHAGGGGPAQRGCRRSIRPHHGSLTSRRYPVLRIVCPAAWPDAFSRRSRTGRARAEGQ